MLEAALDACCRSLELEAGQLESQTVPVLNRCLPPMQQAVGWRLRVSQPHMQQIVGWRLQVS